MHELIPNTGIGSLRWVLTGGRIPLNSVGVEPENTGRDEMIILNAGTEPAEVSVTIFYQDREPVGKYLLTVAPERCRTIRINDLIDPEPVPLDTEYTVGIVSDQLIVADFFRKDSGSGKLETVRLGSFPI